MFEVSVSGWFAAAHQLRLADGTLEPLHGHNWQVTVTYCGDALDEAGMLVDFTVVKPRLEALLQRLHDRNLNELPPFDTRNPSAENVALYIAEQLSGDASPGARVACVEVREAPDCVARYRAKKRG